MDKGLTISETPEMAPRKGIHGRGIPNFLGLYAVKEKHAKKTTKFQWFYIDRKAFSM